jgi:hypothetical protein
MVFQQFLFYLERFISFLNTLRGNTYLERLALSDMGVHDGTPRALDAALREKTSISIPVHWTIIVRSEFIRSISPHPALLRTLEFQRIYSDSHSDEVDGGPANDTDHDDFIFDDYRSPSSFTRGRQPSGCRHASSEQPNRRDLR